MAHLSVYGADLSVTKHKAIEDAKKMQEVVEEECIKAGNEMPPYLLRELIGKGSFGRVYKASNLNTSQVVAVKIIDIEESDTLNPKLADTYSEFLKEINALKLLSEGGAKNINHVLDALPVGQSMWMVTEYCAGGSVATLMKPTAPGGLQEKWIIPILREVAEAIYWVHKAGIIHRDIKCANVLITEAGGVQLCDFGVSGVIETKFDKRSTFIGTPHWMAPELFDPSASYGVEVDIWAFGSMVFEIASGLPPNVMAGIDITQLGGYLKQNTPKLEGSRYSAHLKHLVSYCLIEDPAQRPTIQDVQRHPYLFNTEKTHPTSSLAMLVRAFRVWEAQGGSRKSLFALGGAQGPSNSDLSSTALADDEWNFSTTVDFDQRLMGSTDAQAVYDVYGSQVDLADIGEPAPQPRKPKRRRPPPNLPVIRAPLEKIFDPNTISSYEENARAYYGNLVPPLTSDLPLRDNSDNATLRESLIDLDASLHGSELSRFVDMETLRAGARQPTEHDFGDDYNKPPNSDPETVFAATNRKTQEWKFPSMVPPASASAGVTSFSFNEERNDELASMNEWRFPGPGARPPLLHHPTEPVGVSPSYNDSLRVPRPASQQGNRVSIGSLIDLDESLPDPTPLGEYTRPSTANSDIASETGGAFDLDRHSTYYPLPSSNREPSIYISDDSDLAGLAGHGQTKSIDMMSQIPEVNEQQRRGSNTAAFIDDEHLYTGAPFSGDEDYVMSSGSRSSLSQGRYQHGRGSSRDSDYTMTGSTVRTSSLSSMNSAYQRDSGASGIINSSDGRPLPPLPAPPSERVMMGEGGQIIKDEFYRLLEDMTRHLSFTGEYMADLPVRQSGMHNGQG
ncbi:Serine/threonine-protein kinase nak1 [Cytospora mali]|uniref:non-specific serine/threonine protein kinase n=1 Tax=Cytospora mali TaxID=578113 RepID=A0A194V0U1_CYTMA|nr:Serine/threonine-protein kinase nak1 [Valsa mali var. pyri (nom. inval.)]